MERIERELPGADGLGGLIGITDIYRDGDVVRTRVPVTDAIRQPFGVVHGAAHSVIAESICSYATLDAVADDGMVAMGQSNSATFLRTTSDGHLDATATVRHRGRSQWVWDVEIADDQGRVCALIRTVVAVRPAR